MGSLQFNSQIAMWEYCSERVLLVTDIRYNYLSGSHLQSRMKSLRQMMVLMNLTMTTAQVVVTYISH